MLVWDAGMLLLLTASGALYGRGASTLPLPRWAAFFSGLGMAGVLLVGPVARAGLTDFSVHMVQHVGLMMVAAPLLVLGAPAAVALEARPTLMARVLGSAVTRWLCRPAVGWVVFALTLFATHFSSVASWASTSTVGHQFVLCWFLVAGIVYYYPVLSGNPVPVPVPHPARIVSLLLMMVPETMTGFSLYASTHALHAARAVVDPLVVLQQQRAGGAFMWAAAMAIDACWIALAVRDWLAEEERRADA